MLPKLHEQLESGREVTLRRTVGMQVLGRHHSDAQLFDVALSVERERPWPLVAPNTPW